MQRPVPTHDQRRALARLLAVDGIPAASHAQLTRADYRALRRELKALEQWIATHHRRARPDYDDRWDRRYFRAEAIRRVLPVPRDPLGFGVMAMNHGIRRSHVLARVQQRRLDRRARALDTSGLTPLQAAWARLEISFGGKA